MRRKRPPEAELVGPRRHVAPVDVVRIGDPEGRRGVVRGKQDMLRPLASRPPACPQFQSGRAEVRRLARQGRMTLGLDAEIVDELVARLDRVFEEEAVTDGVEGHVVLDPDVVGAVHRHAAAVGVVDRRVADVLALAVADEVPVDRVAGERQVLPHAR